MSEILKLSLCMLILILAVSCKLQSEHKIESVHEVKPIHITIDLNIKVDKALDNYFGDLDEAENKLTNN